MKRILSLFLVLVCVFGCFTFLTPEASAANDRAAELWMKTGTERALDKGTVTVMDAAPFLEDGTVYLPFYALTDYLGAATRREGEFVYATWGDTERSFRIGGTYKQATTPLLRDGVLFISLAQVAFSFGLSAYYHEKMGMLAVSTGTLDYPDTYNGWCDVYNISKLFVFDYPSAEKIYEDLQSSAGASTHPRLLVTQDRFDALREVYEHPQTDPTLAAWIQDYMKSADSIFKSYYVTENGVTSFKDENTVISLRQPYLCYDENGNYIAPAQDKYGCYIRGGVPDTYEGDLSRKYTYDKATETATYTYISPITGKTYTSSAKYGDGYDEGGRLNESSRFAKNMEYLAFAWQMTNDQKYADAVYLLAHELGKWMTWGESHFLNTADAADRFAIGYDWVYHAFDDEPGKQYEMAKILYEKAVIPSYYSHYNYAGGNGTAARNKAAGKMKVRQGSGGWCFYYRAGNWNNTCTGGVIMSCLSVLEYNEFRTLATTAMEWNLSTFPVALIEYAPDGSYMEGPGYWGCTNSLFMMAQALLTSCGDDYGLLDSVGIENTCYFIYHISSAKNIYWALHDCAQNAKGALEYFYYASAYYKNSDFAYLRNMSITHGCDVKVEDILFYDASLAEGGKDPGLDYYMQGAYTTSMRAGWNPEDAWTGLHVGPNVSDHSDFDCGHFTLEMGGIRWFTDLGAENYNIGNYFNTKYRFFFYRKALESHNTILIRNDENLVHGQVMTDYKSDYGTIVRMDSYESGAVTVADMTVQYGKNCISGKRALLLTADRKTVVIQDEISFSTPTDLTETFNPRVGTMVPTLSADGKTAYLKYGNGKTILRMKLLSSDSSIRFSIIEANAEPILPTTVAQNSSANFNENGTKKYPRATATGRKVVINADGVMNYSVAVVMETVQESEKESAPSYYTWQDIADMKPESISNPDPDPPTPPKPDYPYKLSDFNRVIDEIDLENGFMLTNIRNLARLAEIVAGMDPDAASNKRAFAEYEALLAEAEETIAAYNTLVGKIENRRRTLPLLFPARR